MKRGLEAIIGPRHEQVANIADDVAGCREGRAKVGRQIT